MKRLLLSSACVRFAAPLLSSACCLLPLVSHAAIITERNDVYDGAGCLPPPAYTFIGSPSVPGIDSCWIPYGTYTDGVGGTEYTRVTSNLMGVVASALGGACERGDSGDYKITALRPLTVPRGYIDGNDYFSSATNTSLRLSDQINLVMLGIVGDPHGEMIFREFSYSIEPYLARTDTIYYDGASSVNGGCAGEFGSRVLEQLVGARDPPISTSWTSRIPYDVADADEWVKVCPTFAACSNDLHFYTATNTFVWRHLPYFGIFGNDVYDAFFDLLYALTNRHLNVTVEDVLSADTGWKYEYPPRLTNDYWTIDGMRLNRASIEGEWDDLGNVYIADWDFYTNGQYYVIEARYGASEWSYFCFDTGASETIFQYLVSGTPTSTSLDFEGHIAGKTELRTHADDYTHWRNGTTRLDWKRLGIICQLERQMEIRYDVGYYDLLPFRKYHTENSIMYDTYVTLDLPSPDIAHTTNFPWRSISPSWTKYDENYSITSNDVGWTYPTCRIPATSASGGVTFFGDGLTKNITLDSDDAVDMLSTFVQSAGLTNGEHDVVIYGNWTPQSSELWYHSWRAEDWAWVTHPSNTVTISFAGKSYTMTGTEPIFSQRWSQRDSEADVYVEFRPRQGSMVVNCDVGNVWGGDVGAWGYERLPDAVDPYNGSFTTTPVTFTAVGDGDFTNWTWQVSGLDVTNCVKTITAEWVNWTWEDGTLLLFEFDNPMYYVEMMKDDKQFAIYSNGYPRVITSPRATVEWHTSSNRQWEVVWTNETPDVLDYRLPIVFDATNATVRAMLGVQKLADGAWTCSGDADAKSIVDRFGTSWNRMHSERRLSVEGLLYDCGPAAHSYASDFSSSTTFNWEEIKYHSGSGRLFRMQPDTPVEATSKAMADSTRLSIIRSLDNACKDKCVEMGGANPRDLANFGKVTANDVASIKNALLNTDIVAHYGFGTLTNDFILAGHISDSEVVSCEAGYDTPSALPAVVGYCGWTLTSTNVSASTAAKDVRADGDQSGIVRYLKKFKNLRDPNL